MHGRFRKAGLILADEAELELQRVDPRVDGQPAFQGLARFGQRPALAIGDPQADQREQVAGVELERCAVELTRLDEVLVATIRRIGTDTDLRSPAEEAAAAPRLET